MKKNIVFVLTFLGIIYTVLLFIVINQGYIVLTHKRVIITDNWIYYTAKKERNILDKINNKIGALEVNIENRMNSSFPGYISLNAFYNNINFNLNKLFYNQVPIKNNYDNEFLYYDKDNKFYYLEGSLTKEEYNKRLKEQTDFFNSLSKKGVDINIYIPTRYEYTKLKKENKSNYIEDFKKKLDSNINVASMQINTLDEYKDKFYHTDHHWNSKGALSGYYDIMNLLKEESVKDLKEKELKTVKYYGSFAKSSLSKEISDTLLDIDYQPNYTVSVDKMAAPKEFKPREINVRKDNVFYDYYTAYYNGQYAEIVYDYNQKDKDNLLIFCDSYGWQIDYLIASSFNKTHVINIRAQKYAENPIDIESYIKENNIQKVLFLYESQSTLFDAYNYNLKEKVK